MTSVDLEASPGAAMPEVPEMHEGQGPRLSRAPGQTKVKGGPRDGEGTRSPGELRGWQESGLMHLALLRRAVPRAVV
jgi:hypothetical protein